MLPFDFGTTPATDAGIPGLNLDNTFTSGLFGGFVDQGSRAQFNFGSGLGVNRCNCPLDQDEKQLQFVGNLTQDCAGNHTLKFGVDVRRAWNLRVPSDAHRSGELYVQRRSHARPDGGGLGLATFLLGDVTHFGRYVSPNTDAGERQWRHFYYAQDTWRATPQADAELRPAARRHQPADGQRGRQRRLPADRHRRRRRSVADVVAGVGGVAAERRHQEHVELGAARRRRPISSTRRPCCAPATAAATTSACSARSSATGDPEPAGALGRRS